MLLCPANKNRAMSGVSSLQESSSAVTPKDAGSTGHARRHFFFLDVIYLSLTRSLSSRRLLLLLLLLSINDDDDVGVGVGAEYTGIDGLRNISGMKNSPLPSSSTAIGFEFTKTGFDIYTNRSSNNNVRHSTGRDNIDGDRVDEDLPGSKE